MKVVQGEYENRVVRIPEKIVLQDINKRSEHLPKKSVFDKLQKRHLLSKRLHYESRLVRNESMKILKEFERMEN